ncbi:MAG: hypothetical protein ACE5KZ_07590 [Candidatus Scalinduaceae bacterium]
MKTSLAYNETGYEKKEQQEEEAPEIDAPVELWTFIGSYRFITGKNVHMTVQMIWKLGVSVNVEEFRNVDVSPFKLEKVTIGERQIFDNDNDFLIITYILSLSDDAKEGVYSIPSFTISYKDEVNKTIAQAKTTPVALKKVPILVETKLDRDIVNIGDRMHYELTIWHEKYVEILKEELEKFNFKPFQVIDFEVEEKTEDKLKKTIVKYELSIYEIAEKDEGIEIPSLPVLYYIKHEGELEREEEKELMVTQEINTPAISVLMNSLLKKIDVPLERLKGPVVYSKVGVCLKGHLPIIFGVIIIIFLGVNEIRRFTGKITKVVKEKITEAPLAHAEKLEKLVADFNCDAETDELRKSVINIDCSLRAFLGALVEIHSEEILSFTTTKLINNLKINKVADRIVESAHNALKIFDSVIFGDIDKGEIKKVMNEVQEILKETKRRGYY